MVFLEKKNENQAKKRSRKKVKRKRKVLKKIVKKKEAPQKSSNAGTWIVIALIVVAVAIYLMLTIPKEELVQEGDLLIAEVNKEKIYLSQINTDFERIPQMVRGQLTKEDVLNQTIGRILILSYGAEQDITVADEEVEAMFNDIKLMYDFDDDQLDQILSFQNITKDEYLDIIREEVLLNKILNLSVIETVEVTDEDALGYYEDNALVFNAAEGQIRGKRIIVETEEEAAEVIRRLDLGGDFADLASEVSIGPFADKGGEMGFFNELAVYPEVAEAAFELEVDEYTAPIETQFGYHIILRESDDVPFEMVEEDIRNKLLVERGRIKFQEFMDELRINAEIIYHNNIPEETGDAIEDLVPSVGIQTEEPEMEIEVMEPEIVVPEPTEPAPQEMPDDLVEEEIVVEEEVIEAPLGDDLASCLTNAGFVLYGADWSAEIQRLQEALGDDFANLDYKNCDENRNYCRDAGVIRYGTFVFEGEKYYSYDLADLAALAGC